MTITFKCLPYKGYYIGTPKPDNFRSLNAKEVDPNKAICMPFNYYIASVAMGDAPSFMNRIIEI